MDMNIIKKSTICLLLITLLSFDNFVFSCNEPPEILTMKPSGSYVYSIDDTYYICSEDPSVTVSATAMDPDGNPLTWTYKSSTIQTELGDTTVTWTVQENTWPYETATKSIIIKRFFIQDIQVSPNTPQCLSCNNNVAFQFTAILNPNYTEPEVLKKIYWSSNDSTRSLLAITGTQATFRWNRGGCGWAKANCGSCEKTKNVEIIYLSPVYITQAMNYLEYDWWTTYRQIYLDSLGDTEVEDQWLRMFFDNWHFCPAHSYNVRSFLRSCNTYPIIYSIEGDNRGCSLSPSGDLTLPDNPTAGTLTIKATVSAGSVICENYGSIEIPNYNEVPLATIDGPSQIRTMEQAAYLIKPGCGIYFNPNEIQWKCEKGTVKSGLGPVFKTTWERIGIDNVKAYYHNMLLCSIPVYVSIGENGGVVGNLEFPYKPVTGAVFYAYVPASVFMDSLTRRQLPNSQPSNYYQWKITGNTLGCNIVETGITDSSKMKAWQLSQPVYYAKIQRTNSYQLGTLNLEAGTNDWKERVIGSVDIVGTYRSLYVDQAAPQGGNGLSWSTALTSLKHAISIARPTDTIHLAKGVYTPSESYNTLEYFQLNGITLKGGYKGYTEPLAERDIQSYKTVLNGEGKHSFLLKTFNVAVIDGITIEQGKVGINNCEGTLTVQDCIIQQNTEHGILCNSGELALLRTIVRDNTSTQKGAGVYCTGSGKFSASQCLFIKNRPIEGQADQLYEDRINKVGGGALYYDSQGYYSDISIGGCVFEDNYSYSSSAAVSIEDVTSCKVTETTFKNNVSENLYSCGGLEVKYSITFTLDQCVFKDNIGMSGGGANISSGAGVYNINKCLFENNHSENDTAYELAGGGLNLKSKGTVANSKFLFNTTACYGGAVAVEATRSIFSNCLFANNSASQKAGGLFVQIDSPLTTIPLEIKNCTIADNIVESVSGTGGGIYLEGSTLTAVSIKDSILWSNKADQVFNQIDSNVLIDITYSAIQGGYIGTGNISDNPNFVSNRISDYLISQISSGQAVDSPCVNSGSDTAENLGMNLYSTATNGQKDLGQADRGFHSYNKIIYIDKDATGTMDGTSWLNAYRDPLYVYGYGFAKYGDIVCIAAGNYILNSFYFQLSPHSSFGFDSHVIYEGGYAGNGYPDPDERDCNVHETIMLGNYGSSSLTDNIFHVASVSRKTSTILDGITFKYGYAGSTVSNSLKKGTKGGGLYLLYSRNIQVQNCKFLDNYALDGGSGIYLDNSQLSLINCIIASNTTDGSGGAILADGSDLSIANCLFHTNIAHYGGAIYISNTSANLTNVTIADNVASFYGAGLYTERSSTLTMNNSILWGNTGGPEEIFEHIQLHNESGSIVVNNSCVQDKLENDGITQIIPNQIGSNGTIDLDPIFINPETSNYQLDIGSPCVDAAQNVYNTTQTDLQGMGRILDGDLDSRAIIDMGAYEFVLSEYGNPYIKVSNKEYKFVTTQSQGNPPSRELKISNLGQGSLNWQVDLNGNNAWITISQSSGSLITGQSAVIDIVVDKEEMIPGNHEGIFYITGINAVNSTPIAIHVIVHNGGIIYVPDHYSTIQEALNNAWSRDTIRVRANTYYENLILTGEDIVLEAVGSAAETIIDGKGLAATIEFTGIESSECELNGFTISGGLAIASDQGAGIWGQGTLAKISNCVIKDNFGIGVSNVDGTIENCIIDSNTGGGLLSCNGSVKGCLIATNMLVGAIGGYGLSNCDGNIINCTITSNSGDGCVGCNGTIINCIIWSNGGFPITSSSNPTYSCINAAIDGAGNITIDPLLIDTYHINTHSPCKNKGLNMPSGALPSMDLEGNPRIRGSLVDMGAYELPILTWYVDGDVLTSGNGTSPENAFKTIQEALNASGNGDIISVLESADKIYRGEGNCNLIINYPITLKSINGPSNCIVDCENLSRAFHITSGVDATCVIDGFTIINGSANQGGAILCEGAPQIYNCKFKNCSATTQGGAIRDTRGAKLVNCVFKGNSAPSGGGALSIEGANTEIINSSIANNISVSADGGGLNIKNSNDVYILNSVLWDNAGQESQLMDEINLLNSTIKISNCNIKGCGGSNPSSGIWVNGLQDLGENIESDPLFVLGSDLNIDCSSPCRDRGKLYPDMLPFDIRGNARLINSSIDIGAYEIKVIPVPINKTVIAYQGVPREIRLEATFSNQAATLDYQVSSGPTHGGLLQNLPVLTYTADSSYIGEDKIVFTVSFDGDVVEGMINIQVYPVKQNTAPLVDAGVDQVIVLPNVAFLSGSAQDDGLPEPELTLEWSVTSLDGGAVDITDITILNPVVTFTGEGTYQFTLSAYDGLETVTDGMTVLVKPAIKVACGEQNTFVQLEDGTLWGFGTNYGGKLGNGATASTNVMTRVLGGVQNTQTGYIENILDFSGGWLHSTALDKNGAVYSWGLDAIGYCHDGIHYNYWHHGQLGDGENWNWVYDYGYGCTETYHYSKTPIQVSSGEQGAVGTYLQNIIDISTGKSSSFNLALEETGIDASGQKYGSVWSWGTNDYGQLGSDAGPDNDGGEGINWVCTDYSADEYDFSVSHAPIKVKSGEQLSETGQDYLTNIVQVSAGTYHSMALDTKGRVWTWGANDPTWEKDEYYMGLGQLNWSDWYPYWDNYFYRGFGLLGNHDEENTFSATPVLVHSGQQDGQYDHSYPTHLENISSISAGWYHNMAVEKTADWHHVGIVWDGTKRYLYIDGTQVKADQDSISGPNSNTGYFYLGTNSDQSILWKGQMDDLVFFNQALTLSQIQLLNEGTLDLSTVNVLAHWNFDIDTLSSDGINQAALMNGATISAIHGQVKNGRGALSLNGKKGYAYIPSIINPSAGAFSVFLWVRGGGNNKTILAQTGTSECKWLYNDASGHLATDLCSPGGVSLISPSKSHNHDGRVYTWGSNFPGCWESPWSYVACKGGRLGDGSKDLYRTTPVSVRAGAQDLNNGFLRNIVAVSAGESHSMALEQWDPTGQDPEARGRVYTWGGNIWGQLGNGTIIESLIPILVVDPNGHPLENIVAIEAGPWHSIAVSNTGKIWSWGLGLYGALGNGKDYAIPSKNNPYAIFREKYPQEVIINKRAHNESKDVWYTSLREAVDYADSLNMITLSPGMEGEYGIYQEYITIEDETLTIKGTNTEDSEIINNTIIQKNISIKRSGNDTQQLKFQGLTFNNIIIDIVGNSSVEFESCIFNNCRVFTCADYYNNTSNLLKFVNCEFVNDYTAAIYCMYNSQLDHLAIENSKFRCSTTPIIVENGRVTIKNNVIYGRDVSSSASGICLYSCTASSIIRNNTIFFEEGRSISVSGTIPDDISNCIFWSREPLDVITYDVRYSNIKNPLNGVLGNGYNNISQNPSFMNIYAFRDYPFEWGTKSTFIVSSSDDKSYSVGDVIEYVWPGQTEICEITNIAINGSNRILTITPELKYDSATCYKLYKWPAGTQSTAADLRLRPDSPCIDRGTPGTFENEVDCDREIRVVDGSDVVPGSVIDIGADEFVRNQSPTVLIEGRTAITGVWQEEFGNLSIYTEIDDDYWINGTGKINTIWSVEPVELQSDLVITDNHNGYFSIHFTRNYSEETVYTLTLTATELHAIGGPALSASATLTLIVVPENAAPVITVNQTALQVDMSDLPLSINSTVLTVTDDDLPYNGWLSYYWKCTERPTDGQNVGGIAGPSNILHPEIGFTMPGNYKMAICVSDGMYEVWSQEISITVTQNNVAPEVNIFYENLTVTSNPFMLDFVTINDEDSLAELILSWSYASSSGGVATFSDNVVNPTVTFTPPPGTYVLTLTVTDTQGATGSDQISVNYQSPVNTAPVVDAGDDIISDSLTITLNGTINDDALPAGREIHYQWIDMADGTVLPSGTGTVPGVPVIIQTPVTFSPNTKYAIKLKATEKIGTTEYLSSEDIVNITIAANDELLITTGEARTLIITENNTISLTEDDVSIDYNGFTNVGLAWDLWEKPQLPIFDNENILRPAITFACTGRYVLRLTATHQDQPALFSPVSAYFVINVIHDDSQLLPSTLPYSTTFREEEGYVSTVTDTQDDRTADLNYQDGWVVNDGIAFVAASRNISGAAVFNYAALYPGTVINKTVSSDYINDKVIRCSIEPEEYTRVEILCEQNVIAGVKFVEGSAGRLKIQTLGQDGLYSGVSNEFDKEGWAYIKFKMNYQAGTYDVVVTTKTREQIAPERYSFDDVSILNSSGIVMPPVKHDTLSSLSLSGGYDNTLDSFTRLSSVSICAEARWNEPELEEGGYLKDTEAAITNPCACVNDEITGIVPVAGTVWHPSLIKYQILYCPVDSVSGTPGIDDWYTADEGRKPVEADLMGNWDTSPIPNGYYYLGLRVDTGTHYFHEGQWLYGWDESYYIQTKEYTRYEENGTLESEETNAIYAVTGELKCNTFTHVEEADITVSWPGQLPFELRRMYNNNNRFYSNSLPYGWTHNFHITLSEDTNTYFEPITDPEADSEGYPTYDNNKIGFGYVWVTYPDGSRHMFKHKDGYYHPDRESDYSYKGEAIYYPYPENINSGEYVIRTTAITASTPYDIFALTYELHTRQGDIYTFNEIYDRPTANIVHPGFETFDKDIVFGNLFGVIEVGLSAYQDRFANTLEFLWYDEDAAGKVTSLKRVFWDSDSSNPTNPLKGIEYCNTDTDDALYEKAELRIGTDLDTIDSYIPAQIVEYEYDDSAKLFVATKLGKGVNQNGVYDSETDKSLLTQYEYNTPRTIPGTADPVVYSGFNLTKISRGAEYDIVGSQDVVTEIYYDTYGRVEKRKDYIDAGAAKETAYQYNILDSEVENEKLLETVVINTVEGRKTESIAVQNSIGNVFHQYTLLYNWDGANQLWILDTATEVKETTLTFEDQFNRTNPTRVTESFLKCQDILNPSFVDTKVRTTENQYDPLTGDMTDTRTYINTTDYVRTQLGYNNFGLEKSRATYQSINDTGSRVQTLNIYGTNLGDTSDSENGRYLSEIRVLTDQSQITNWFSWPTTKMKYYPNGLVWTKEDPDGNQTEYIYDVNWNPIKEVAKTVGTDQADIVTKRSCYDNQGRLELEATQLGAVTCYDYDEFGRAYRVRTYKDSTAVTRSVFVPTDYESMTPETDTYLGYDARSRNTYQRKSVLGHDPGGIVETTYTLHNQPKIIQQYKCLDAVPTYELSVEKQYYYNSEGLKIAEQTFDPTQPDNYDRTWISYVYDSLNRNVGTSWYDYKKTAAYNDENLSDVLLNAVVIKRTAADYYATGKNKEERIYNGPNDTELKKRMSYEYDILDRLLISTFHMDSPEQNAIIQYGYDATGNLIYQIDPEGNCIFTDYDSAGRKVLEYFAVPSTEVVWNGDELDYAATRQLRVARQYTEFYKNNQVKSVSQYDYGDTDQDHVGDTVLSHKSFNYDQMQRLTHVFEAIEQDGQGQYAGADTYYAYYDSDAAAFAGGFDEYDIRITDGAGKKTWIKLDELGNRIETRYPSGQNDKERYAYYGNGSVQNKYVWYLSSTNPEIWSEACIQYAYDAFGRVKTIAYPLTPADEAGTISYDYTGKGQLEGVTDSRSGFSYAYAYDVLGRTETVVDQENYTTSYSYTVDGQKSSIQVYDGSSNEIYKTSFEYDEALRLKTVYKDTTELLTGFTYTPNGNRATLTHYRGRTLEGNKIITTYQYTSDNYLESYTTGYGFNLIPLSTPSIDGLGRMKSVGERIAKPGIGFRTISSDHTYDLRGQLMFATRNSIYGNAWSSTYNYDLAGNIDTKVKMHSTSQTTGYQFSGDLMTGWQVDAQTPVTLDWDDYNGRLRQSESSQLDYNLDGRLVSATSSAGTMTLAYDPLGNRIYRAFDNGTTTTERKYIVDTVGDLPVILMELDAASGSYGSLKKSYYYANSQVLAQWDHTDPDGDGVYDDLYFYMHDRLGSVRLVIDESAAVMHYYIYDPFGQMLETGSAPDIAPTNAFLFTGQWYDTEIGQYYLRARMYDPSLMRFTTRDPVKGQYTEPMSLHAYLYCLDDPINRTDPTGKMYLDLLAAQALISKMRAKTAAAGATAMELARRLASQAQMYAYQVNYQIESIMSGWGQNLRANLSRVTGEVASKLGHAHHLLPQKFVEWFTSRGINNINDPRYGMWVDPKWHQQISYAWNAEWEAFKYQFPYATVQQIEAKAAELAAEFGCPTFLSLGGQ